MRRNVRASSILVLALVGLAPIGLTMRAAGIAQRAPAGAVGAWTSADAPLRAAILTMPPAEEAAAEPRPDREAGSGPFHGVGRRGSSSALRLGSSLRPGSAPGPFGAASRAASGLLGLPARPANAPPAS
jgi:hypothetical protein